MRCCAEVVRSVAMLAATLLALAPGIAAAQDVDGFAGRVSEAVAVRWGVPAADVRVTLTSEHSAWPSEVSVFRLLGNAADGRWIVAVEQDTISTRLLVRAGIQTMQPVAARDLARGETLRAEDIAFSPTVVWGPPQKEGAQPQMGWTTHRRIAQGEALRAPAVAPPIAIRSGDEVQILYVRSGISIALSGRAAGQAAVGERIAVRTGTGKRLQGIAEAPGVVRIESPGKDRS